LEVGSWKLEVVSERKEKGNVGWDKVLPYWIIEVE